MGLSENGKRDRRWVLLSASPRAGATMYMYVYTQVQHADTGAGGHQGSSLSFIVSNIASASLNSRHERHSGKDSTRLESIFCHVTWFWSSIHTETVIVVQLQIYFFNFPFPVSPLSFSLSLFYTTEYIWHGMVSIALCWMLCLCC